MVILIDVKCSTDLCKRSVLCVLCAVNVIANVNLGLQCKLLKIKTMHN